MEVIAVLIPVLAFILPMLVMFVIYAAVLALVIWFVIHFLKNQKERNNLLAKINENLKKETPEDMGKKGDAEAAIYTDDTVLGSKDDSTEFNEE